MNNSIALEVKNVCKTYLTKTGDIDALKNITLSIKQGEIFGLLGPNLSLIHI